MYVCLDGADRTLDNKFDSDRGGEMKYNVALIDQLGGDRLVVHALDGVVKMRVIFQVANIFNAAGGKIVDDKDFVAALQICVGKMRANETRAARD